MAKGERPQRHFQPVNASRWRRCETDSYHSCVPHMHFPQSCEVVSLDSQPNLRHELFNVKTQADANKKTPEYVNYYREIISKYFIIT